MVAARQSGVPALDPDAAREFVRREHAETVARVNACADAVAASWPRDTVADAGAVSTPLETRLDDAGVLDDLVDALVGAVTAAGANLPASPVAAPPYVVVTSRGPVLRATVGDERLVVHIDAFTVTEDGRYERAETTVRAAVR